MLQLLRKKPALSLLIGICFFVILFVLTYTWGITLDNSRSLSRESLKKYQNQINDNPRDPALLLEAARYHFHFIRNEFKDPVSFDEDIEALITRGLGYYRRIISGDDWSLNRSDYFNIAYLYFQLARLKKTGGTPLSNQYLNRAKVYALKAHDKGFRNPELNALLGNIYFEIGVDQENYRIALNYYESLGEQIRDPVMLLNKTRTLLALNEYKKAKKIINRLSGTSLPDKLQKEFRVVSVELSLQRGNYQKTLDQIRNIPKDLRGKKLTSYMARSLMNLGQYKEAERILERWRSRGGKTKKIDELLEALDNRVKENADGS